MEPMPRTDDTYGRGQAAEFHGVAGWPAQPKLVPTVITWTRGGGAVEVEGSFDNWTSRQRMQKSGKDYTIVKLLPPGVYQYKFVVDGEWQCASDQPAVSDDRGNVNNVLEVQEYVPENLEGLSGFSAPASPPHSYDRAMPMPEDYAKEPPGMPPHLQLTLLNVPAAPESASALPRPQHVVLNHLYCQRNTGLNALIIGTTHRYRNKYVTTVMYKPRRRYKTAVDAGLHQNQQLPQQQQEPRLQTAPQLGGQHHEAGSGHTSPRPIPARNSM
eukprot:jgi/Astpho2/991/Aster-00818